MITPEVFIKSYESYRPGDKAFCQVASISDMEDDFQRKLGFWIEVVSNDSFLVASIRFESFTKGVPVKIRFYGKKQLEDFIEEARQYISKDLEKILSDEEPCSEDKQVA